MKLKKLLAAVTAAALAVTTMAVTSFTASAETVEFSEKWSGSGVTATYTASAKPDPLPEGGDEWNDTDIPKDSSGYPFNQAFDISSLITSGKTWADVRSVTFTFSATGGNAGGSAGLNILAESSESWGTWTQKDYNTSQNSSVTIDTPMGIAENTNANANVGWINYGTVLTVTVSVTFAADEGGDADAVAITVSPATKTIKVGETFTLSYTAVSGTVESVEWIPQTENIVEVSNEGVVKALKAGTVEVRAKVNGDYLTTGSDYCLVTVEAADEGGDDTDPSKPDTSEWQIAVNGFNASWGGWQAATATVGELTYTCTIKDVMDANSMTAVDELGGIVVQAWNVPLGDKVSYAIRIEAADGTVKANDTGTWTVVVNGGTGDNKDEPNYSLKQYSTEVCYGEYEFAPTDVVKVAIAAGETIPTIPSDNEHTPPVTGSALWEGNTDMGTAWSENVQIAANKFADIKAGDTIKFTFTCNDNSQLKIMSQAENWPVLPGPNPDPEWGVVNVSGTSFSFELTAADVTALKENGMVVSGQNVTLTKVELVPKAEPKPPVVNPDHTHTAAGDWKSDSTNHWHVCECGEKMDNAAHTFDSGVITTPATETTAGVKTYTCSVCKATKTETIPATGSPIVPQYPSHSTGSGSVVIPIGGVNNSRVPTVNGKNGWEAVSADILSASDGDKLVVDMNSATKVPSTILGDIDGKDIDVVFNMGRGITWTINGLSVTSRKTIDLDISKNTRHIPDEVVDKAEGSHKKQISLDHKGTFGCTATLTYEVGTKHNGLYANIFYYNPKTEQLEFADCSLVSGGKAKFVFTHASDYLITISDEPLGEFEDVSSAAGIASDDGVIGNAAAFGSVLAVIVLGFGIVVYRKRRHN